MKYILSDIKRGYKIKTIMNKHDISATLVIACMHIIQRRKTLSQKNKIVQYNDNHE